MRRAIGAVLAILILALGCGGPRPEPVLEAPYDEEPSTPEETAKEPEPEPEPEPEISLPEEVPLEPEPVRHERQPYTVAVGDLLNIRFFYYPTYNLTIYVRPDGAISIPHIGEVMVEGMRPSELERLIRDRYSDVLAEPEVSVIVMEFAEQRVFVFGEVKSPGAVNLTGTMTIMDAIANAGGPKYTAKMGSVILIRKTPAGMYQGTRIDVDDMLGSKEGENLYLAPSDVVYVPISTIGKVDLFVEQFFQKISPVWMFYIYGERVINPDESVIIGK